MTFYSVSNPFPLVLNRQGTGLNDGDVYFGVAGRDPITHPKTVYWNIGGTDAADQPIPTTGGYYYRSGTPANVFVDSTYSIKVLDKNGDQVFYAANVYDPVFQIAADLATFEASLAAPTGSDLVGHDANILGSIATTVGDKLREFKSVKSDFGATGDGSTDDTAAFVAARTYANSVGGNCTIWIPDGTYKITGAVGSITVPGVCWVGSSNGGAILNLSYDGPAFTHTGYAGGYENILFSYPSAPPANAVVILQDGGTGQNIKNCRVNNVRTFVQIGTLTTSGGALTVSGLNGNAYNGGSPFFKLYGGAGLWVLDAGIYVAGVGNPATDRVSTMTTVSGTSFIKTNGKTFDTIVVGAGSILERWWRIFDFTGSGAGDNILNVFTDSTLICDYISDDCVHLESAGPAGGNVAHKYMGHMNSWSGRTVSITGAGGNRDIDMLEIKQDFSGKEGVLIDNANGSHFRIGMGRLVACDRLNGGKSAININSCQNVKVFGEMEAGYSGAYGGANWQPPYGITTGADLVYLSVTDVDCAGLTKNYNFGTNTVLTGNRVIRNNLGADYAGRQSAAPYTAPADSVPWINYTGFEIQVTIGGGTVTGLLHNGVNTGLTSGTLDVNPGESFTIGYTVAPTVLFFVKP